MAPIAIKGISSMATRQLLADLGAAYARLSNAAVHIESVGGVEAARRVAAGEAFDVVVLASDAIDKLITAGHLHEGSKVDLVHSGTSVAVPAGAPLPNIRSESALKAAVLAAHSLGYSTGPSGVALAQLFQRWGIAEQVRSRVVTPPPGVPVGSLVASGEVALGFQQLSELMNVAGITIVGPLPPALQITTTFSAAMGIGTAQGNAVRSLLAYISSPATAETKRRHGMEPA